MKHLFISSLCIIFLLLAYPAFAGLGLGGYASGSFGYADYNVRTGSEMSQGGQRSHITYGGGIALDSNIDGENIFSYRFKAGAEKADVVEYSRFQLIRIHQWNYFTFNIVRLDVFRLWVGPMIGIHYDIGRGTSRKSSGIEQPTWALRQFVYSDLTLFVVSGVMKDRMSNVGIWCFKGGAVAGMNFNVHRNVTLTLEVGAAYGYTTGTWRRSVSDIYTTPATSYTGYGMKINSFSERVTGHIYEAFVHVGFLARGRWTKFL